MKEFYKFSFDAETFNMKMKHIVIDDSLLIYIKQPVREYESAKALFDDIDAKLYDDYWLERVEIDFRFKDIKYYIQLKDTAKLSMTDDEIDANNLAYAEDEGVK